MRIHIPVQVRWADLDAYGHVNNAAMLTLAEEARIHGLWSDAGHDKSGEPVEAASTGSARVFQAGPDSGTSTLIARQEVDYLMPIPHYRDPIEIEMWVGKLGGASFDVCYEIYSPAGQTPRVLFTRVMTVIVMVDTATMRPRKMNDAERAELEKYVEEPIVFGRG